MSRAPLHPQDTFLRLSSLPLGIRSEQGFAMSEGAVWCEQAAFPGSDLTGPVHAVGLQPRPDAVRSDLDVRRNVEQPVHHSHTQSLPLNVLFLFRSSSMPASDDFCNSAPPRGCGYRNVNHAGIRVQVESFFPQTVAATPQHGVRDD